MSSAEQANKRTDGHLPILCGSEPLCHHPSPFTTACANNLILTAQPNHHFPSILSIDRGGAVHICHALWARSTKNTDCSTRPLARPFTRIAHSFACSALRALLARSAALTRSLACSLCSLPRSWECEFLMSHNDLVLSHSALS